VPDEGVASRLLQLPVLTQRRGRLAESSVDADQIVMRVFSQRVGAHTPVGIIERALQVARAVQPGDQPSQRVEIGHGEPLTLEQDPAFVIAGEQLAAVEIHCPRQLSAALLRIAVARCLERIFELRDVGGDRGGVQAHGGAIRLDQGAGAAAALEIAAEGRERLGETVPPAREVGVRPEEVHEHVTRMGTLAVERQVGEQEGRLPGAKVRHDLTLPMARGSVRAEGSQAPEELDSPVYAHAELPGARFSDSQAAL
jgi:hypothetical protein